MSNLKITFALIVFAFVTLYCVAAVAQPMDNILVTFVDRDPAVESILGKDEKLYVLIRYESDIPLRFQAIALRDGSVLEVGAFRNPAALHSQGSGEALVWISYNNPTHIDAVGVTVFDEGWRELYRLSEQADVAWQGTAAPEPRKPAEWVETLIRAERRKMDYVHDASPQKNELLYDLFFVLSILSIPAYVLLQFHMLRRYRYRWRELATLPLFPYLILAFYTLVGLDIESSLRVTFLFRYTPMAFLFLVALWIAKRFWQNKLPPPKLYKPPQA